MKWRAATLAGVFVLAASAPALAHANGASMLAAINAERASAGISPVAARSEWSSACAAHDQYMDAGHVLTHAEDAGTALFSAGGSWAASRSILAYDTTGFAGGGDPWTTSPLHQFQALHPWLRTTGVDVTGRYACMVTLAGRDGGYESDPRLITYPGVGQAVAASEVASESPLVPGVDVGLPAGTITGPHLFIYAVGPQHYSAVSVRSASLTDANGVQVAVRWVDSGSPQSGTYLDGGAIVIPVRPLTAAMTYTLRVEVAATTADETTTIVMARTSSFAAAPTTSVTARDTAQAASGRQGVTSGHHERPNATHDAGAGTLRVALAWDGTKVRARLRCVGESVSCTGPLRILVNRRGGRTQTLRFVAGSGPLHVDLASGRSIVRRVTLSRAQRRSAQKRGFQVRWGGPAPIVAKALGDS